MYVPNKSAMKATYKGLACHFKKNENQTWYKNWCECHSHWKMVFTTTGYMASSYVFIKITPQDIYHFPIIKLPFFFQKSHYIN